ncbi:MAG TPA: hypothetical protein VF145_10465, partial [Chitinophagaceae bacterium]
ISIFVIRSEQHSRISAEGFPYKYGGFTSFYKTNCITELTPGSMTHEINLETAMAMTRRFRSNLGAIVNPEHPGSILPYCETFNKEDVLRLLDQPGCSSIRIYRGADDEMNIHSILVGVNDKGEDMLPPAYGDGVILEDGLRCPEQCPPPSSLNSENG